MNECENYCLLGGCRINRARIVTEAAFRLNGWIWVIDKCGFFGFILAVDEILRAQPFNA